MQRRRLRGACLQCVRRKRKCDHKHPRCSQCVKNDQVCQPQTFKTSTPAVFSTSQPGTSPSAASEPLPTGSEPQPGPLLREAPVAHNLPPSATFFQGVLGDATDQSSHGEAHSNISPEPSGLAIVNYDIGLTTDESEQIELINSSPSSFQVPQIQIADGTFDSAIPFPFLSLPADNETSELDDSGQIILASNVADLPIITDPSDDGNPGGFHPIFATDRLYCPMPWPDDMLASPERRFLWQYFLSIAEADFLCLDWGDVGHFYGFQHPYITTLPHMALSNNALRASIFCFAASQYQLRHSEGSFERIKALTGSEAVMALSTQNTQVTDDNNLLSMISAATLLHYFGTERHDYLRFASRLVKLFLTRAQSGQGSLPSFPEVSLSEFRWSVISTLCSIRQPSPPLGDEICTMIEMRDSEIQQKYSTAFQRWISHPIYTFSPRLVNPLLRIGRLLERQLSQLGDPDIQLDDSWLTKVNEAEEMLLHARECDMNVSASALGSADPAAVLALNESMYAAGSILLYARINALPATAPFVRRQTQLVTTEIAKIPANSHVSFAIVFPLFVAGCEAIEQQMRDTIVELLREPKGITFNRGDLVGALQNIWAIRDLEPGLPWPYWVEKVEPQYRISCLM
ncbi:fungal-specific transcription factor domain-containing protein [Stachybotrys elegans]|uniref:Fungal-specific transcription factor domain-containing protein n=1 Tax=Stachybotrys elegans TaxID=80388 RepID=A0A8K0SJG4_9HYPO|nr:fungal-specific transcription factor domain-containing protein [Stachybotrys elegans]